MKRLIRVKITKKDEGIMYFKVWREKYQVKINYSLPNYQQIENFLRGKFKNLNLQILLDDKNNMFIIKT